MSRFCANPKCEWNSVKDNGTGHMKKVPKTLLFKWPVREMIESDNHPYVDSNGKEVFRLCDTCKEAVDMVLKARARRVKEDTEWQPMETAPKDRPILAWCEDDCKDPHCAASSRAEESSRNLCLYHAHAEGMLSVDDGYAIVEWGGAWDDRTWEDMGAGHLPDWWFRVGSEFEEAANPVAWAELPLAFGINNQPQQEESDGKGNSVGNEAR